MGPKAHLPLGFAPLLPLGTLGPCGGRPSPPGAGPLPHLAHAALRGWWPHLVDPRDPSGGPGTLPIKPKTFPVTKQDFPYINLYLRTILELLVTSGISSGTPNNIR